MPSYDERRAILARDGLASVEGIKLSILLTYEHLLGMRVCVQCPNCTDTKASVETWPCQDLFGNNATPEGRIFGRVDGAFTSIEAQKSVGSLHAHSQVHVECIHQHTPLHELVPMLVGRHAKVLAEYLKYKEHVCRQV